jgi:hypothetical protein
MKNAFHKASKIYVPIIGFYCSRLSFCFFPENKQCDMKSQKRDLRKKAEGKAFSAFLFAAFEMFTD